MAEIQSESISWGPLLLKTKIENEIVDTLKSKGQNNRGKSELNAEKFKKGSSYERNLIAIYESGFTNAKTFNFGVSAFACYINHVRKMQRKNIDGKFVELTSYPYGTKKKFKDIEVVVTDVRTGTSKYSGKSWMLINAAYDNKYRLQWWGNDSTVAPNIGDKLTITANIKKNDEFRGNAYTELNHVKVN